MSALKLQIDTQYIQLSEANIKLTTFQRDSTELAAVKEKNQVLERRISDLLAEDSSAKLRHELEEAKRIAASLQIQVKDLERTVDEWVRRAASAEERLSEAQHRLIEERSARQSGSVVPAGPSDQHAGSREEWMHRAIVAERRLEHLEKLGPVHHAELHSGSDAHHQHHAAEQVHVDASIKSAMRDLAHSGAAHESEHHQKKSHQVHHPVAENHDDHGHGKRHHVAHHAAKHDNHHDHHDHHPHDHEHASHHVTHGHDHGHAAADHDHKGHRGSSRSREHSADKRESPHATTVAEVDNTGLSLSVNHGDAADHSAPHADHHHRHHDHHGAHHAVQPQSAKSAVTLDTAETLSNPSTLKTKSNSPHPHNHLPPKHPFTSPGPVTYASEVIFDQQQEEPDADHQVCWRNVFV